MDEQTALATMTTMLQRIDGIMLIPALDYLPFREAMLPVGAGMVLLLALRMVKAFPGNALGLMAVGVAGMILFASSFVFAITSYQNTLAHKHAHTTKLSGMVAGIHTEFVRGGGCGVMVPAIRGGRHEDLDETQKDFLQSACGLSSGQPLFRNAAW